MAEHPRPPDARRPGARRLGARRPGARRLGPRRLGPGLRVGGVLALLVVYLLAGTVGAVRPGWLWLLYLAGALFLVTVLGAAWLADHRRARA